MSLANAEWAALGYLMGAALEGSGTGTGDNTIGDVLVGAVQGTFAPLVALGYSSLKAAGDNGCILCAAAVTKMAALVCLLLPPLPQELIANLAGYNYGKLHRTIFAD